MASTNASVTVAATATTIIPANVDRQSFSIHNAGTVIVYIAENAATTLTAANGIPILPNEKWTEDGSGTKVYTGAVVGITSSGTSDVRYWERTVGAT